ncbi:MAG: hypothetical protein ABSC53_15750 [Bacteroidota bacterium]
MPLVRGAIAGTRQMKRDLESLREACDINVGRVLLYADAALTIIDGGNNGARTRPTGHWRECSPRGEEAVSDHAAVGVRPIRQARKAPNAVSIHVDVVLRASDSSFVGVVLWGPHVGAAVA